MLPRSDLYAYQTRIAEFIRETPFCAVFADMGLGKTASTLTAMADMRAAGDAHHALVVAPLRVARQVWTEELHTWQHLSHLTTQRALGTPEQRWTALKTPADIHLTNRERTQWLEGQFIQDRKQIRRFPWDFIVLDESQSFRSQSSQRWKSMRRLRRLCKRMVLLTGTPSPNGLGNLWAQFYLLDQGKRLGASEEAFRDRWFIPVKSEEHYTRWEPREHAAEEIYQAVSDISISLRAEDYLTLPPVVYNPIRVDLPVRVFEQYRKFERECLLKLKDRTLIANSAGAIAGKLLQFANGAVYHDKKGNWSHLHDEKITALLELLDGLDGPAIVCYGFKHDLSRLKQALGRTSLRVAVLDTQQSIANWNNGETDVLLLHPASAGHGLNLQHSGSETLIWFGLTPDLELYDQANARLIGGHRRAQRNVVIHHILANGTRDERILSLLRSKKFSQDALMRALSIDADAQEWASR